MAIRAIYATDEVRFANIDASFGFDQVDHAAGRRVDFLLGYAGDMPLVNLVASTRGGGWLFPANHANRAAARSPIARSSSWTGSTREIDDRRTDASSRST